MGQGSLRWLSSGEVRVCILHPRDAQPTSEWGAGQAEIGNILAMLTGVMESHAGCLLLGAVERETG